jgi:transcriptional regulator with XRE-family HTH domain
LRETRKEYGISQEKLAEMIGIFRSNLSKIEKGRQHPSEQTKDLIEKALGVKVDWVEVEGVKLKGTSYYKAERSVKKLIEMSLTLNETERKVLIKLITKYFNIH